MIILLNEQFDLLLENIVAQLLKLLKNYEIIIKKSQKTKKIPANALTNASANLRCAIKRSTSRASASMPAYTPTPSHQNTKPVEVTRQRT